MCMDCQRITIKLSVIAGHEQVDDKCILQQKLIKRKIKRLRKASTGVLQFLKMQQDLQPLFEQGNVKTFEQLGGEAVGQQ